MSAAVRVLAFLAFFVVVSEALHKISLHFDDETDPIEVELYDEKEYERRHRDFLDVFRNIEISEPSIQKLSAFFIKYQMMHKEEPTTPYWDFRDKHRDAYRKELLQIIRNFPKDDKVSYYSISKVVLRMAHFEPRPT
ncbi:unnamed protein product [Caenorhabditis auriculariae]|uniref:Uncharacterized protein n=1 Tax=Caenorhabditis auriculariae TaxID=2777116 RepID=A0A8S1HXC6_9PELO|nr:unnamed protein product [Caenorhabditis auriculariae]